MYIKANSSDFKKIIMNCDKICDKKNFDYIHFKAEGGFLYISVINKEGVDGIEYTGKCKLADSENGDIVFIIKFTAVKEIVRLMKEKSLSFIEIMDANDGIKFKAGSYDIAVCSYDKDFSFMNNGEKKSNIEVDYGLLIKSMKVWANLYKRKKSDIDNWKYFYIEVKESKIRYIATNGAKLLMTEAGSTEAPDAVMAIPYDIIKQVSKLKEDGKEVKLIFTLSYLSIQGEDFEIRIRNNGRNIYNYNVFFDGLKENGNTKINSETFRNIIDNLKIADSDNYSNDILHLEIKDKRLVSTLRVVEGEKYNYGKRYEAEYNTLGEFDGSMEYWSIMGYVEDICDAFKKEEFEVTTYTIGWMLLKTKERINILMTGCYHDEQ